VALFEDRRANGGVLLVRLDNGAHPRHEDVRGGDAVDTGIVNKGLAGLSDRSFCAVKYNMFSMLCTALGRFS